MGKKFLFNPIEGTFDIVGGEEANCLLALPADQININANTVINLQDNIAGITVNNNIVFNNGTHRVTLQAGKTYKLQAFLRHYGSTSNTASNYRWYDVTNTTYIGQYSQLQSQNAVGNDGIQQGSCAIITPSTNIEVELRCTSVSVANQGLRQDATYATIEKISETFTNVVTVGSIDEKLKRVDNDLWETAQDGVEYYSPKQYGRKYGIVYRQYFTTSLPSNLTTGNNVSKLLDYYIDVHNGTHRYPIQEWSSNGTDTVEIVLSGTSGNGNLSMGSYGAFSGNIIDGYVDYTK